MTELTKEEMDEISKQAWIKIIGYDPKERTKELTAEVHNILQDIKPEELTDEFKQELAKMADQLENKSNELKKELNNE